MLYLFLPITVYDLHLVSMSHVIVTFLTEIIIWTSNAVKNIASYWRITALVAEISSTGTYCSCILELVDSSANGEGLWFFDCMTFGDEVKSFAILHFWFWWFEDRLVGFIHDKTLNALDGRNPFEFSGAAIWWQSVQFEIQNVKYKTLIVTISNYFANSCTLTTYSCLILWLKKLSWAFATNNIFLYLWLRVFFFALISRHFM